MSVVLCCIFAVACASAPAQRQRDEQAALKPVTQFVTALTTADMDSLLDSFHDDATVFMPFESLPTRRDGTEEIRAAFTPMFEQLRSSGRPAPYMRLTPADLQLRFYGSAAVVTFHLGSLPAAGATEPTRFSRRSAIVTQRDGRWRIAHLHASNMTIKPETSK